MDAPPSLPFSSSLLSSLLLERVFFFNFWCVSCVLAERDSQERDRVLLLVFKHLIYSISLTLFTYTSKSHASSLLACTNTPLYHHCTFYFSFFFPQLAGQVINMGPTIWLLIILPRLGQVWTRFGQNLVSLILTCLIS